MTVCKTKKGISARVKYERAMFVVLNTDCFTKKYRDENQKIADEATKEFIKHEGHSIVSNKGSYDLAKGL